MIFSPFQKFLHSSSSFITLSLSFNSQVEIPCSIQQYTQVNLAHNQCSLYTWTISMFVDVKDNTISNAISCKLSDILQIYCILFLKRYTNFKTQELVVKGDSVKLYQRDITFVSSWFQLQIFYLLMVISETRRFRAYSIWYLTTCV